MRWEKYFYSQNFSRAKAKIDLVDHHAQLLYERRTNIVYLGC